MDALALLCTLHADGPTTLHRLRAAGCHELSDLVVCRANELAAVLSVSTASAERMQREAQLLGERLEALEPEEAGRPVPTLRVPAPEPPPEEASEPEPARRPKPLPPVHRPQRAARDWFAATRCLLASSRLSRADLLDATDLGTPDVAHDESTELTRAVEALAREIVPAPQPEPVDPPRGEAPYDRDVTLAVEPTAAAPTLSSPPSVAPDLDLRPLAAARERLVESEPAPETAGTPLRVGVPAGLDAALLEELERAGVRTAEELVESSGLELSRKLTLPFTKLLELQLSAQHLYRRAAREAERSSPSDELQPVAPKRRHTDLGRTGRATAVPPELREEPSAAPGDTAGPFA